MINLFKKNKFSLKNSDVRCEYNLFIKKKHNFNVFLMMHIEKDVAV